MKILLSPLGIEMQRQKCVCYVKLMPLTWLWNTENAIPFHSICILKILSNHMLQNGLLFHLSSSHFSESIFVLCWLLFSIDVAHAYSSQHVEHTHRLHWIFAEVTMNGKSFDERKQRTNEKIDRRNASEKFSHSDFVCEEHYSLFRLRFLKGLLKIKHACLVMFSRPYSLYPMHPVAGC